MFIVLISQFINQVIQTHALPCHFLYVDAHPVPGDATLTGQDRERLTAIQ